MTAMAVEAPCGCVLEATHRRGDRLHSCRHGHWKVSAELVETVRHTVEPIRVAAK